jgi:hypothetical protein
LHFYAEFLAELGKEGQVFIKHFNGKSDLGTKLETLVTPRLLAEKQAIGVIVDANGNAQRAATELSRLLNQLTTQTILVGTWTSRTPKIGLFVTPGENGNGEIETLVWRAWCGDPANGRARQCIEDFVRCMGSAGFQPRSPDKGLGSSFLAIRNDEDPRLGPGARAGAFNFAWPEFAPLRAFLAAI